LTSTNQPPILCPAKLDNNNFADLYLQLRPRIPSRVLLVGEVLWDEFPDARRLGGAPLNVAAHLRRIGHEPRIVSAVGADALGRASSAAIAQLGLDATLLQSTDKYPTGRAIVHVGPGDQTSFTIERPAAYDAVEISDARLQQIVEWDPRWLYYGTLFPSRADARRLVRLLITALPRAARFYDLNLRPGFEQPDLVDEMLQAATVVKLNERELQFVHEQLDLPSDPESFCRAGSQRYGWRAACVTFGARGCAMLLGAEYVRANGLPVAVVDPVGAGDAFAAAFLHGIVSNWPPATVADVANRQGAQIAGSHGAIPDWMPRDPVQP
jgi:fructokinase